jgi:hypothetical protein
MQDIEAAAAEVRAKNPHLSKEQAMARALRANPALYNRYEAEHRAAGEE